MTTDPHLASDRLADLASMAPAAEELAHLASCASCRAERARWIRTLGALRATPVAAGAASTAGAAIVDLLRRVTHVERRAPAGRGVMSGRRRGPRVVHLRQRRAARTG